MSVKIIAELNPFSRERVKLAVEAKPIAEIITQLDTGFPLSQARVCRNGEIVTDFSTMARDGDTLAIKFVPYGSMSETGAGMKVGGWALAILGGVLIVTGYGAGPGVALIGAGVGMIAGGTVLMNINIPTPKDTEKPDSDPSIRGGKNQARPYGRIPVLFGRHRIYPDLAANPHTKIIDGRQYYTQLFCAGYKDCVIDSDSVKLGETSIVKLSQTKSIAQILSGADPVIQMEILQNGEASNLYPYCVHEDAINAPLQNQIDDGDGNKISGEVIRDTPDSTDMINVDIFFHSGLGEYNKSGSLEAAEVIVEAWYKKDGDPDYTLLGYFDDENGSNTISGSELKTKRCQITKSGLTPGQYTVKVVRITPDSTNSKVIDTVHVGSIRSIKSKVRPIRRDRQKDLTVVALRVMATGQLNGIVDSFNFVAVSQLPVYSGQGSGALYWLNAGETRNPAAMLLYALRGRAAQQRVDPDDIDWASLEDFYTWCEEHNYTCNAYLSESVTIAELMRMIGGAARADVLRIDSKISVVQDIERPSPAQLFTPKNTKSYSVTMFSADIPHAIALRYIDEDSGYAQNEVKVHNTPDGNPPDESPETIQKIDLWGITDSVQARRIGMYNYACLKNRPFVHTIEADIEYLICNKGDWIQYAGDIALTGSVQGRIKGVIWADGVCIGIDTDEPVVMENGRQYAVRIRKSNGTIILKDAVFSLGKLREKSVAYYPGESEELYEPFIGDMYAVDEDNVYYEPENVIYFTEPLKEADAPKAGDIYAFGVRGYEALDLIITDIQPGQGLTAVLTCVEYSPEIFGVDDPDFILPEFKNRITPVSGAVDSGVVNPDSWKPFVVYHDGEDEPERPSGNGQGGGWHYAQTFRSLWQSGKMAESVESGEWGLPVRIRAERGSDDVTPTWLSLSPQNVTLETDGDGNLLAGIFPVTVQARLFRWNSVLQGVVFSLSGAPQGVTIDSNGLVTIAANAALGSKNDVSVNAVYQGETYNAALSITKNAHNSSAPRYLGTVEELPQTIPQTAKVLIIKGPVQDQVTAQQGDFVLAVAAVRGQAAGSVFQWTGVAWEYREPSRFTDLYIRCFKDGLDVPGLKNDVEWFGSIITGLLVAQKGFIEALEVIKLILKDPGFIQSDGFVSQEEGTPQRPARGFKIKHDGGIEANNIKTKNMEAKDAYIEGGISVGGAWDKNGREISSTLGGLWIPSYSTVGKMRGMQIEGGVLFIGHGEVPSKIEHLETILQKTKSSTFLHPNLYIQGRMTCALLATELQNRTRGIDAVYYTPLNGSIYMESQGVGDSPSLFILTAMKNTTAGIRLYGLDTRGLVSEIILTDSRYVTVSLVIL